MDLMLHRGRVALGTALVGVALCGALAAQASAAPRSHGAIVDLVKPGLRANANSSNNWFGYNQGTLEQGGKQFNSITGDWTVPTATPARRRPGRVLVRLDRDRRRLRRRRLHGRRQHADPDRHRAGRLRRRRPAVLRLVGAHPRRRRSRSPA